MNLLDMLRDYWPLLLIAAWFVYKRFKSQKVVKMLPQLRSQGAIEIDVRSSSEFSQGSAPTSLNIPLQEFSNRLSEIPKNIPIILCCASGGRSGMAKMILEKNGYPEVYNIGPWTNLLG
jgi:rhodanese-related sulfurtransferase